MTDTDLSLLFVALLFSIQFYIYDRSRLVSESLIKVIIILFLSLGFLSSSILYLILSSLVF